MENGYNNDISPVDVLESFHNNSEQIAGILFRNAYGGLAQDPPMISQCIDWLIQTNTPLPTLGVESFKENMPTLLISLAAIDYHICSNLVKEIVERHSSYTSEFIRTVIWNCSSGINYRKKSECESEWKECWKEINEDFKKFAHKYLSNILQKYNSLG